MGISVKNDILTPNFEWPVTVDDKFYMVTLSLWCGVKQDWYSDFIKDIARVGVLSLIQLNFLTKHVTKGSE